MTKIHQTGTREAWTFKHADHADPIVIMAASTPGRWYVIREHGHQSVNPVLVMSAEEIFETFGFEIFAWEHPANVT